MSRPGADARPSPPSSRCCWHAAWLWRPGAAIDAGVGIANLTDGAAGTAPGLGAYELGAAVPAYGPRG